MEAITHGRFGGLIGRPQILLPAPGGLIAADRGQRPKVDTEHLASSSDCSHRPTSASLMASKAAGTANDDCGRLSSYLDTLLLWR